MNDFKIWPIGKIPKEFQRPELDQVREYGYDWKDPWDVVDMFEQEVAKFAGCKYGIALDNSTNGLFLCLEYIRKEYYLTDITIHQELIVLFQWLLYVLDIKLSLRT